MMLMSAGVRDQPLEVTSTAVFLMLSKDKPSLPALLPPTMIMVAYRVMMVGCAVVKIEASLLMVRVV